MAHDCGEELMDPRVFVCHLVENNPKVNELQFIRDDPKAVDIRELSGGQVNYVFRVTAKDGLQSVIIKHAKSTAKGCRMELPRDRVFSEFLALEIFYKLQPGFTPRPICLDRKLFTVVMEDLGVTSSLMELLQEGCIDREAAIKLASFIGHIHNATAREATSDDQWEELSHKFLNKTMLMRRSAFHFDGLLDEHDEWNKIEEEVYPLYKEFLDNDVMVGHVRRLQETFLTSKQCLMHGDVYFGDVNMKNGNFTLFDMEFTALGPRALDLGTLLGSYTMFYFLHWERKHHTSMFQIRDACKSILYTYLEMYAADKKIKEDMIANITGYIACFALRGYVFRFRDVQVPMSADTAKRAMLANLRSLANYQETRTIDELIESCMPSMDP